VTLKGRKLLGRVVSVRPAEDFHPRTSVKEPVVEPRRPTPPPKDEGEGAQVRVHVGNLSVETTDDELRVVLQERGFVVIDAFVVRRGLRSLGYGFVSVATSESVNEILVRLKGIEVAGRMLEFNPATPRG
jgi:RNA recognition motif-containing protein